MVNAPLARTSEKEDTGERAEDHTQKKEGQRELAPARTHGPNGEKGAEAEEETRDGPLAKAEGREEPGKEVEDPCKPGYHPEAASSDGRK